jgi:hypothetical protein
MSPTVHGQLTSGLVVHSQVVRLRHAYAPPIIYAKLAPLLTAKHEGVGGIRYHVESPDEEVEKHYG